MIGKDKRTDGDTGYVREIVHKYEEGECLPLAGEGTARERGIPSRGRGGGLQSKTGRVWLGRTNEPHG